MGRSFSDLPVEEIEPVAAPDRDAFLRDYLRPSRPAVFTGLARDWLAPAHWTFAAMAERHGTAQVIAASLRDGVLADDSTGGVLFEKVALADFIASAGRPGAATHYVMAPTWNFPAAFAGEYGIPTYCAGAPYLRAKVWLGKAGTVTPMHRDVPHNLHVHLSGKKRWLLFAPGASRMYPRGLLSTMPNFSLVDPERPDLERFPRFGGVRALGATVGPGDTLFIPHGWWHHTRTLEDAVAMNFWWGGGVVYLASLASTAFKRLRGIRREEWG
jgi:lysine-specific demethylase 8